MRKQRNRNGEIENTFKRGILQLTRFTRGVCRTVRLANVRIRRRLDEQSAPVEGVVKELGVGVRMAIKCTHLYVEALAHLHTHDGAQVWHCKRKMTHTHDFAHS